MFLYITKTTVWKARVSVYVWNHQMHQIHKLHIRNNEVHQLKPQEQVVWSFEMEWSTWILLFVWSSSFCFRSWTVGLGPWGASKITNCWSRGRCWSWRNTDAGTFWCLQERIYLEWKLTEVRYEQKAAWLLILTLYSLIIILRTLTSLLGSPALETSEEFLWLYYRCRDNTSPSGGKGDLAPALPWSWLPSDLPSLP